MPLLVAPASSLDEKICPMVAVSVGCDFGRRLRTEQEILSREQRLILTMPQ